MIANEFEEAAAVLPDSFKDLGRVNKYVAMAYAAKVYLYKPIARIRQRMRLLELTSPT